MKVCALCGRCYGDSVISCSEESHPVLSETRHDDPDIIAGYRLDVLLESGPRGETYRARQTECNRSCLIRIFPANTSNSEQFLREARLATAFFHPHVVDVYEAGSLDSGELFVVAEDPAGKDLRGFLKNIGVPELLTTIEVIRQTAEALDALHREGLVHRAINPENIILTTGTDDRLLVQIQNPDVGGVIHRSIVSNKFLIDSALDSLRYFAPEQCSGSEATVHTDVYSLGVVLFEMLAGEPPFNASKAAALIEKHRSQRPPEVKIDNFELRMLVTHALTESLQKYPASRQSSANLFARQLRHIEQLATHVSTPPPAGTVPIPRMRPAPQVNIYKEPMVEPAARVELYREEIQPVAVRIEQPVVPMTEHEPISAAVEHEPVPVIELVATADSVKMEDLLVEEPSVNDVAPVAEIPTPPNSIPVHSRVSRLKQQMKSWRAKVSLPRVFETPVVEAIALSEFAEAGSPSPAPPLVTDEAAKIVPTKIEWENLEDDIPTVADVLEILSKEDAGDITLVQPKQEEIEIIPSKVEPAFVEEIAAVPETVEPIVIEAAQPEPDVPTSVAATAAEILEEEPEIAPVIQAKPKQIITRSKKRKAIPVVREEPKAVPVVREMPKPIPVLETPKAIPIGGIQLEDVAAIPAIKPAKVRSEHAYARIPWVKGVLKSDTKKEAIRIPVVRDELEEITLVRARRRPVRIDLDRPVPSHAYRSDRIFSLDTQDAVRFVPTLLGDIEKRRTIDIDPKDAIFSSYDGQSAPRSRIRRRLVAAAGVSVALIVGFLFADDLGRYLEAASSDDTAAATTTPAVKPAAPVSPVKKQGLKNIEKSQPAAAAINAKETKPVVTKERGPARSAETSRTTASARGVKAPDTSKAKPAASSADKKRPRAENKSSVGTRPRVVTERRP